MHLGLVQTYTTVGCFLLLSSRRFSTNQNSPIHRWKNAKNEWLRHLQMYPRAWEYFQVDVEAKASFFALCREKTQPKYELKRVEYSVRKYRNESIVCNFFSLIDQPGRFCSIMREYSRRVEYDKSAFYLALFISVRDELTCIRHLAHCYKVTLQLLYVLSVKTNFMRVSSFEVYFLDFVYCVTTLLMLNSPVRAPFKEFLWQVSLESYCTLLQVPCVFKESTTIIT